MSIHARTTLYFVFTGIAWGAGFLFIRLAVNGMSPVQYVFARTAIAAIVLAAAMAVMRRSWPRGWLVWRRIGLLGAIGVVVPFLLYAWAGERIPSGLSSIYNAAAPISTALITLVALRQEMLGLRRLGAIATGGIGILIVLAPWRLGEGAFDLGGQLACIAAVLAIGFAFAYTRKAITPLRLDPIGVAMGQMLFSALLMGVIMPFAGFTAMRLDGSVVFAVLASGVIGTGFAYVWNFRVIDHWGAASASMVTYVVTLVGVLLGITVLSEPLTVNQLVGAVIVLAGVGLGVTAKRPSPPAGGVPGVG